MYVRLKFRKEGPVRFIGHLDLMRTFQKMFIRASVPVAYSEGYNPHQIFSFATALAVGISSEGEYLDLRLAKDIDLDVLIKNINEHAPMGIHIEDGIVICKKEPKAMAILSAADYVITLLDKNVTNKMIEELLSKKEVVIKKKTKKGRINDFDILPGLLSMTVTDNHLYMRLSTGSKLNIKPEMVLKELLALEDLSYNRGRFVFHRKELFQDLDGLKPLLVSRLGSDCNDD